MSRPSGKKIRKTNREDKLRLAAMSCAVLLCAAAFVLTLTARVYLTALSEETAQLSDSCNELIIRHRIALADNALELSPYKLTDAAREKGMLPPGQAERQFLKAPGEDVVVLHEAYKTKLDKPKTIWEYFG